MKLSIVVPIFNEEHVISVLADKLTQLVHSLPMEYEIICVNDGSKDASAQLLSQWVEKDDRVTVVTLSRNFGHQAAITAGLAHAQGDAVVIMDADLQDSPSVIVDLIAQWKKGYKVVLAIRQKRNDNFIRHFFFSLFYRVFAYLVNSDLKVDSGVFGLMDKEVVKHILSLSERNRFLPGLRAWVGFSTAEVVYVRQQRVAGEPKQSIIRLLKYGFDAIFSFSYRPLRACLLIGVVMSVACFIYALVLIGLRIANINVVTGFTTPTVAIFFVGGLLLISNGLLGEYIARIYDEVKNRPLYIIESVQKKKSVL